MIKPTLAVCSLLLFAVQSTASDGDGLRETVHFLSSLGSRISGYPGGESAADYVEDELRRIGVGDITREPFEITVPLDKGGELIFVEDGESYALYGMWPNLVRTTTLPPAGYAGEMIYGGEGDWSDYNGRELDGRIVLLAVSYTHLTLPTIYSV